MRPFMLASLVLLACTPTPREAGTTANAAADTAEPATREAVASMPAPAAAVAVELPARTPGPLVVTPREAGDGVLPDQPRVGIDPDLGSPMDSIELFGWTADSQRFAHCRPSGGRGGLDCESHGLDGSKERFNDDSETEDVDAKKHRAIRARMKALVRDADTWAWGGLVEIVWRDREGGPNRPGVVEVGARLRGSTDVAFPIRLPVELYVEEFAVAHLTLAIPSPDGEHLALVAHGFSGEFSDTFETRLVPVDELAAEAYNAGGLAALRANDPALAATHFTATAALSKAWKGPYNLACARTRAGDASAEAALREAIARGGDTVRTKARTDEDFADVRDSPWFAAAIAK